MRIPKTAMLRPSTMRAIREPRGMFRGVFDLNASTNVGIPWPITIAAAQYPTI